MYTLLYMSHIIGVLNCSLQNIAYCKPIVAHGKIYENEFTYIGHMKVPTIRCRFYIHVTYMLQLHIRYTYVLNQPCGFAYMSHICNIYVDQ